MPDAKSAIKKLRRTNHVAPHEENPRQLLDGISGIGHLFRRLLEQDYGGIQVTAHSRFPALVQQRLGVPYVLVPLLCITRHGDRDCGRRRWMVSRRRGRRQLDNVGGLRHGNVIAGVASGMGGDNLQDLGLNLPAHRREADAALISVLATLTARPYPDDRSIEPRRIETLPRHQVQVEGCANLEINSGFQAHAGLGDIEGRRIEGTATHHVEHTDLERVARRIAALNLQYPSDPFHESIPAPPRPSDHTQAATRIGHGHGGCPAIRSIQPLCGGRL